MHEANARAWMDGQMDALDGSMSHGGGMPARHKHSCHCLSAAQGEYPPNWGGLALRMGAYQSIPAHGSTAELMGTVARLDAALRRGHRLVPATELAKAVSTRPACLQQ